MRTAASRTRRSHVTRERGLRDGEGFRTKQRNSSVLIPAGYNAHPCYSGFLPLANTGRSRRATLANWPALSRPRALTARRFKIGVAIELAFVEPLQPLAFRDGHASVPDGPLAVPRQGRVELRHVILHVFQHLVGRVA